VPRCDAAQVLTESFAVGDQEVRWGRWGDGPPLVLCHGTPWSSALWAPIADALTAEHTVYLWDMLGYGASTMADGDVSLAVQGRACSPTSSATGDWTNPTWSRTTTAAR